jgi:hypothetical protein
MVVDSTVLNLEEGKQSTLSESVPWGPNGRTFRIMNITKFEEDGILEYFPSYNKISSFTRKLNRWGFGIIRNGPDRGAYFHPFSSREEPKLCLHMTHKERRKKCPKLQ